jgi:hypothetical protein
MHVLYKPLTKGNKMYSCVFALINRRRKKEYDCVLKALKKEAINNGLSRLKSECPNLAKFA